MTNIGSKIKGVVDKKGMTVSEFGRRINKSRENVYSIFKRKTIDTGLLITISKVLEHDFFQYYTSLPADIQKLKDENQTLKEMISFLKSKKKK
ncbi:MAG: XRE family transcriptional regulator [Bacteroidia bacterium]